MCEGKDPNSFEVLKSAAAELVPRKRRICSSTARCSRKLVAFLCRLPETWRASAKINHGDLNRKRVLELENCVTEADELRSTARGRKDTKSERSVLEIGDILR